MRWAGELTRPTAQLHVISNLEVVGGFGSLGIPHLIKADEFCSISFRRLPK